MEPKWANTACFCVSFPISSFGFTQTLQTPPGHPLCSVWPCLVVWLVPTSCPGCVAFTDQSVLEASIWDLTGRGGSCQSVFPRAHSSLTTSTWMDMPSPGGVSQAEGWMNDLSTFPRNSRGRVSSPRQSLRLPHPPRRLCLPHRCEIRREGDDNDGFWSPATSQGGGVWKWDSGGSQRGHRTSALHPLPCLRWLERKQIHFSSWWTGSWTPSCWVFPAQLNTLRDMSVRGRWRGALLWKTLSVPPAPKDHASVGAAMRGSD